MPSQEQTTQFDWLEATYNIFQDLLHRWLLILGVGITAAIAVDLVISFTYVPKYSTGAVFVMKNTFYVDDEEEMEEIAEAFDYILKSNVFLNQVKEDIGVKQLNGYFNSARVAGTNMIRITATADKPRIAYLMMYSMLDNYMEISQKVIGDTQLEVIEKMTAPRRASNELSHTKNLLFFGVAGIGFMILLLGALSYMKDTIKGKNDISEKLHIRTLGTIPKESKVYFRRGKLKRKQSILISQISTSFLFIEELKKMRSRVERLAKKYGYKVLMVTSSAENEGKSSVIVNLALSLAQNKQKVLVLDMDLRKPAVYKVMDMPKNKGMLEVIRGENTWQEAVIHDKRSGLDFLLNSEYMENASELLESPVYASLLKEMSEEYDYILIDGPPVSYMSDAVLLARISDAVLMVIRQNCMPVTFVNRAIQKIMVTKTPVIGGVLNQSMRKHYRKEEKHGRRID